MADQAEIQVGEDGPYTVPAGHLLNGEKVDEVAWLCRCGATKNKPYCDGSHREIGFAAGGVPASAPPAEGDGRIEWEYRGDHERPFYTKWCGSSARLPNGNTLITESDDGRAFEVTREGEIVWEFYNPHRVGADYEKIATLFELIRLPEDFPTDWAEGAGAE